MTVDDSASVALIRALSGIWRRIQQLYPDVPPVIVLPAPSSDRRYRVLGHFAPLRWRASKREDSVLHEVVVVAEHLDRGAEDILGTLLHEAAHAANFDAGIFDCSPTSQYHNARFQERAERMGLTVGRVPNYGWAHTTVPAGTLSLYAHEITGLESVLIHRFKVPQVSGGKDNATPTSTGSRGDTSSRSRLLKATCACEPPHIIRASRKVLDATEIVCRTCGETFRRST